MLTKSRLDPAAARQFLHQVYIRFVKTSSTIRPRIDNFANVYHFTGDSFTYFAPSEAASTAIPMRGLRIVRQSNRPSENIGSKLAPVVAAGCTAGKSQIAVDGCSQHSRENRSRAAPRTLLPAAARRRDQSHQRECQYKSLRIRRSERKALTVGNQGIRNTLAGSRCSRLVRLMRRDRVRQIAE